MQFITNGDYGVRVKMESWLRKLSSSWIEGWKFFQRTNQIQDRTSKHPRPYVEAFCRNIIIEYRIMKDRMNN